MGERDPCRIPPQPVCSKLSSCPAQWASRWAGLHVRLWDLLPTGGHHAQPSVGGQISGQHMVAALVMLQI